MRRESPGTIVHLRAMHELIRQDLIALAALARTMLTLDAKVTPEEVADLDAMHKRLAEITTQRDGNPYRGTARQTVPLTPESWRALQREAADAWPDPEAVREAAYQVPSPEACEAIYILLYELATSQGIAPAEWRLLEWLRDAWELEEYGS